MRTGRELTSIRSKATAVGLLLGLVAFSLSLRTASSDPVVVPATGYIPLPSWIFDVQTLRARVLPPALTASTSIVGPVLAVLHELLAHGGEVILLFELGLLVEHLRLLNRLGDLMRGITRDLDAEELEVTSQRS